MNVDPNPAAKPGYKEVKIITDKEEIIKAIDVLFSYSGLNTDEIDLMEKNDVCGYEITLDFKTHKLNQRFMYIKTLIFHENPEKSLKKQFC